MKLSEQLPIQKGDRITAITQNGRVQRATVDAIFTAHPHAVFRWSTPWQYEETCRLDEEHTRWIRGWPDLDSEDVQALLATAAMGPPLTRHLRFSQISAVKFRVDVEHGPKT